MANKKSKPRKPRRPYKSDAEDEEPTVRSHKPEVAHAPSHGGKPDIVGGGKKNREEADQEKKFEPLPGTPDWEPIPGTPDREPTPAIPVLGPKQKYFETPDGRILVGPSDAASIPDPITGKEVNPKR